MESFIQNFDWHQFLVTILGIAATTAGLSKFKFVQPLIQIILKALQDNKPSPEPTPVPTPTVETSEVPTSNAAPVGTGAYLRGLRKATRNKASVDFLWEQAEHEKHPSEVTEKFMDILIAERKEDESNSVD